MKKYIYLLLVMVAAVTSACKQHLKEMDKGSAPLALTATTAVMSSASYSETGLALSWTTGTNYGTGYRIYYTLDLTQENGEYDETTTVFTSKTQMYEYKWTCDDINAMLLKMGYGYDEDVALKARITASVEGFDNQVAEAHFTLTTYKPTSLTLYAIGTATPGGDWKPENATELTRTDIGQFKGTVKMKQGMFKLICTNTSLLPGYGPDQSDDTKLVYRESDKEYNARWTITEDHLYEIRVDLLKMTISIKQTDAVRPDYTGLAFVGGMTGWTFEAMKEDPLDPFIFRYGRLIVPGEGAGADFGEFKFATMSDTWGFDWSYNLKATEENAPYTSTAMTFVKGYDPDMKWYLKASEYGAYKIRIDLHDKPLMYMTPYTPYDMVYMVGDATPNGWSIDDATALTREDDYTFTWEGKLNDGELKFTCDRQSDWNGAWFMPIAENAVPTGEVEDMLFIDKSSEAFAAEYEEAGVVVGEVDRKWVISAGTYSITLNQLTEKITIIRK